MVKSNLKLIDVTLKLLLDAKRFSFRSLLSFQGSSQRFHGALVVLTGIVELLLLLSNSSVNLLADLAELKLRSQDLILLLLKSTFSFLKSSLEFFLLLLKTSALLVQVMDRAASISKLVKKILDFISKVLVLTLDNVKLFKSLILSRLQAEELRAVVAALILGSFNFSGNISSLGLPFAKNLIKVLASLLSDQGSSMNAFILHSNLIKVSSSPGLRLLVVGNLGSQSINIFFRLNNSSLELSSCTLKLINLAHTFSFISGSPQLNFSLSLRQGLQSIRLPHVLILNLFLQVLQISRHILVLSQKSSSILGFSISKRLGVLKLGGQGDLALIGIGNSSLKLLNLSAQILVFNLKTLLGGLRLIQGSGHLIKPGVGINNRALKELTLLVQLSLALNSIF